MRCAHTFALWLAAAIVTIAVCIMPSGAMAHGTHEHGRTVAAAMPSPEFGTPQEVFEQVAAPSDRCGPHCPIHAGHACCATGLTPMGEPTLAPPPDREQAAARDAPSPRGIAPKALPEPPRPLA